MMRSRRPRKDTQWEKEYVRDMQRTSAFELIDQGKARILSPEEYPEPLKRFLERERTMVHLKLSPARKRQLDSLSRKRGVPAEKLVLRWIGEGLERDTNAAPDWPNDPVVAEVRAIRAKLWKEAGGTFEGLMELIRRRSEREHLPGRSSEHRGQSTRPRKRRAVR
jgi:hypothetical protein